MSIPKDQGLSHSNGQTNFLNLSGSEEFKSCKDKKAALLKKDKSNIECDTTAFTNNRPFSVLSKTLQPVKEEYISKLNEVNESKFA